MERGVDRVVAFLHTAFPYGGAERVTEDVALYLCKRGYKVIVFCGRNRLDKPKGGSVTVIQLPDSDVNARTNLRFMADTIRRRSVSVLTIVALTYRHIDVLKQQSGCRIVYAQHSKPFWEIECKMSVKRHQASGSWRKLLKWYMVDVPRIYGLRCFERRYARIYRKTLRDSDAYVVLCDSYRQNILNRLQPDCMDAGKIRVIRNSERRVPHPCLDKKKQVLYVGRLSYADKRVDRLLDVWQRIYRHVPDWELVIVGDGDEREALERQCARCGLRHVRFVGYQTDVSAWYREASVLCLVSSFEGWPLCLTEAQANGVVPMAFDCVPALHEILAPSGENGVLIPAFDIEVYADRLLALLLDEPRLSRMRVNVLKKAADYSIDKVGVLYKQMIEELMTIA